MLKDITLGQYFPGTSPLHRMDPRSKLLILVLYIVTIFCCGSLIPFALCTLDCWPPSKSPGSLPS